VTGVRVVDSNTRKTTEYFEGGVPVRLGINSTVANTRSRGFPTGSAATAASSVTIMDHTMAAAPAGFSGLPSLLSRPPGHRHVHPRFRNVEARG
jgi:hypothetical protein